jgi:hypothetical protein
VPCAPRSEASKRVRRHRLTPGVRKRKGFPLPLHRQIRKTIKTRGHFPNEEAARKLIYVSINNAKGAGRTATTGAQHYFHSKSTSKTDCPDTQKVGHPREVEAEVARLLGDPVTARILRAAGEPDAPVRMCDEEQHVVPAQKHRLDGEEVAGDDARTLRAQELAPARSVASRRWLQLRLSEQPPYWRPSTRTLSGDATWRRPVI